MQGFVLNTRRALLADRRVREALGLALDFEWLNRQLFYDQYVRLDSFYSNGELAATGLPSKNELSLLEPLRDRLDPAVFGPAPLPPSTRPPGSLRQNLRRARDLLAAAGWTYRDGALRNAKGEYVLLNGNQTLVLLLSYQLTRWAERGELDGNQYVVKTIVTSQMANAVADYFKVKCYDCLTGFKYIAKIIRENEGKAKYIGGGEESFGYLAGDYVRDKDAVSACSLAAEAAAWAMDTMGLTLYEWLQELYVKYGFYREGLVSVVRKGKEGAELIQKMMVEFRANPPKTILGSPVVKINDFLTLETTDVKSGAMTPIVQDRSNVLQWFTEDGTTVSVRPSGTEPKIKFYFGVKAPLASVADFDEVQAELDAKMRGKTIAAGHLVAFSALKTFRIGLDALAGLESARSPGTGSSSTSTPRAST